MLAQPDPWRYGCGMGRGKRLEIALTPRDRRHLQRLLRGGLQAVCTVKRALALLQMDQGQSTPAVGANPMLSAKAVWQIGKQYQQGGVERVVFDAARSGISARAKTALL